MAKKPGNTQNTIHCDICGEDYAATYKRCPFCEGIPPEEQEKRSKSGTRTNTRGGGYSKSTPKEMLITVVSLALIVAAACIVVSILMPLISNGEPVSSTVPSAAPTASAAPTPSPSPAIPADQTATGLVLDQEEFTISDKYPEPVTIHVEFQPAGSKGYVEWTSSDESVATVDENGVVTGVGKGEAIVTATLAGGAASAECLVRCTIGG